MSPTPWHVAAVLLVVLAAGCAAPEDGTLTVGTDAAYAPFEVVTDAGGFEGFDIDVMDEVAKRNGWKIDYKNLVFDTLIPALQNKEIDFAISAMSINANRSQFVDFSIPYYEANQSVLQLARDTASYASLADLKGKGLRFGAQGGTVAVDVIEEELPGETLRRYDTYPLALTALKAGEVDVVVMDAPVQRQAAKDDASYKVSFEFNIGDVYGIALPKGSADLGKVNDALEAMRDDGTLRTLREKWGV